MNILETANYLNNLRISLAETERLRAQLQRGTATLRRHSRDGWSVTFTGKVVMGRDDGTVFYMPVGEEIPLPWSASARCEEVARDIAGRFPDAAIVVSI